MESVSPLQFCSSKVLSTATALELADPLVQMQWFNPICCLSIISHSYLLREALIHLLETHWGGRLAGRFGDRDLTDSESVPRVISSSKHLVLLDYGIGRETTLSTIQQSRSLNPAPYIVVLELKHDTDLLLDCIQAGAHAYALQSASGAEIMQVVEQVYQGVFQCSPEITAKLFHRLSESKNVPQPKEKLPLTRRELEVLHYVAKAYSDREIATQLVVEVRTVKHHVHNILQKLKVRNRWDAAQLALENCWLDPIST